MPYEAKTKFTNVKVSDFIAGVENETRRADAKVLVKLFEKVTGWKAKMFGPTIVGFGVYDYTYASGTSGSACVVGFSPRKGSLVIYAPGFPGRDEMLKKLGKHKGPSCIYINKLADVDVGVLEKIVKNSTAEMKKKWPVTAT